MKSSMPLFLNYKKMISSDIEQSLPGGGKVLDIIRKYNQTVIIAVSAIVIALFSYFSSPGPLSHVLTGLPIFQDFRGDIPEYTIRFTLSTLLFALIPLIYIKITGHKKSYVGLSRAGLPFLKQKLYIFLIAVCIITGLTGSMDSAISSFYPYSKTMAELATDKNPLYFLIHIVSYVFFYYIPWEIFFRGFLIIPFLPPSEPDRVKNEITPAMLMTASFQVIPSSIIHFGHPLSETVGAIPFGILCGWLVLKYRSIIPGLILHIIAGISTDFFIVYT